MSLQQKFIDQYKGLKKLGSLALSAGFIKKFKIVETISNKLPKVSHLSRISHGEGAAAILLNFLSSKQYTGIANVQKFVDEYPIPCLVGSTEDSSAFSQSTLGDTLYAIAEYGPVKLSTEIIASLVDNQSVIAMHLDSTSIHLHRTEDDIDDLENYRQVSDLDLQNNYASDLFPLYKKQGYSRDGNEDLPQINILGLSVRNSIFNTPTPVYLSTFDGHINDARRMYEFVQQELSHIQNLYPNFQVLVADSALANAKTISALTEKGLTTITRIPDCRTSSKNAIKQFNNDEIEKKIFILDDNKVVQYAECEPIEMLDKETGVKVIGRSWIFKNEDFRKQKTETFTSRANKELTKLTKELKKLKTKPAACKTDAEKS